MSAASAHRGYILQSFCFSRTCGQHSDFFQQREAADTPELLDTICDRTYDILWLSFVLSKMH